MESLARLSGRERNKEQGKQKRVSGGGGEGAGGAVTVMVTRGVCASEGWVGGHGVSD